MSEQNCRGLTTISYSKFFKNSESLEVSEGYNIVDQFVGRKYDINSKNYIQFFNLVNNCLNGKTCMHLSELQKKEDISCFDIDLDIKQINDTNAFDLEEEYILRKILNVICDHCIIDGEFYVSVCQRSKITKNHKDNTFKNGFHIKIFLKFSHDEKYFILKYLHDNNIFNSFKLTKKIVTANFIDLQSLNAPVLLYGSNKREYHDGILYQLSNIYCVNINDALASYSVGAHGNAYTLIKQNVELFTNLPLELSLFFNGEIINNKDRIKFKTGLELVTYVPSSMERKYNNYEDVANFNNNEFYLRHILLKIYKECRYSEFTYWKSIIIWLSQIPDVPKNVAIEFSKKWDHYNAGALSTLNRLWDWGKGKEFKYALLCIEKYAREDNYELFIEAYSNRYKTKIHDLLIKDFGNLHETTAANLFEEKYAYFIIYQDKIWWIYDDKSRCWNSVENLPRIYLYNFITIILKGEIEATIDYILTSNNKDDEKYIKNLRRSAELCTRNTFITAVTNHLQRMLEKFPKIMFDSDEHSHIIGLANGVFNLKTFTFVDDPRDLYITRHTRASLLNIPTYDVKSSVIHPQVDVTGAVWPNPLSSTYKDVIKIMKVIDDIISDEESKLFIMCYLASSLNCVKKSPIFFIWHGNGKNGKSTLDELMQSTMGGINERGYSYKMPSSFYCDTRDTLGPETAKMPLQYARYVGSGEINKGSKLHISRIKEITSDTISGNEKYGKQQSFRARGNYILSTNDKPRIRSTDYGTIRRLYYYLFKNTFVDDEPKSSEEKKCDSTLYNEIFTNMNYLNAFLEILVYYYMIFHIKYNEIIENIPHEQIKKESKTFYLEQDYLSAFIDHELEKDESSKILFSEFYTKYVEWHKVYVDNVRFTRNELRDELDKTKLKSFIKIIKKEIIITKHRFIEEYEKSIDYKPLVAQENISSPSVPNNDDIIQPGTTNSTCIYTGTVDIPNTMLTNGNSTVLDSNNYTSDSYSKNIDKEETENNNKIEDEIENDLDD